MDKLRWIKHRCRHKDSEWKYEELPSDEKIKELGYADLDQFVAGCVENIEAIYFEEYPHTYYGAEWEIIDSLNPIEARMLASKEEHKLSEHLKIVKNTKQIVRNLSERINYINNMANGFPERIPVGEEPADFIINNGHGYYMGATWMKSQNKICWYIIREQSDSDKRCIERLKK